MSGKSVVSDDMSELRTSLIRKVDDHHSNIQNQNKKATIQIKSSVRKALGDFLRERGFTEISPVIISPATDPLDDEQQDPVFDYYGHDYRLTQSMIFHKQLSLLSLDRIFSFSPNIRMEKPEEKETGRHLTEFTQLDLEVRQASREKVMRLGEEMVQRVIKEVRHKHKDSLESLDREIKPPEKPFEKIPYREAEKEYGEEFEMKLSEEKDQPFWIIDFPIEEKEFYYREHPEKEGVVKDMDLMYPDGFEEAVSGGEREHKPQRIKERIEKQGVDPEIYDWYLKAAEKGIPPSAGFGIGLERLTRYICGHDRIEWTTLFPKPPGEHGI